jgi:dihydroneopterin aldolase
MADTISVKGIRARGRHGVLSFEREIGQPFIVDVDMSVDTSRAGDTDDLRLTVDYGTVATEVTRIITGPAVQLIETLAARIAERIRQMPGVEQVTVTVHKPFAPVPELFDDVTVRITR